MRFLLISLLALLMGGQKVVPTTARTDLAKAMAGAKKWQADAILVQVNGTRVGADGKLTSWDYGFYSASANVCARIIVYLGEAHPMVSKDAICKGPELKEFMDSDKAMSIARSSGVTKPGNMVAIIDKGRAIWMVTDQGGVERGDVMLNIDAMTGAVLSKMTM